MASLEEAVQARFLAFAGLTALVSGRIYADKPSERPTYPFITHECEFREFVSAMGSDSGLAQSSLTVQIFGETKAQVVTVLEQVNLAIKRYRGTSAGVSIQGVYLEDEDSTVDEDTQRFEKEVTYKVWHGE